MRGCPSADVLVEYRGSINAVGGRNAATRRPEAIDDVKVDYVVPRGNVRAHQGAKRVTVFELVSPSFL